MSKSPVIMKFGGSSVATAALMKQVTKIVGSYLLHSQPILVVSACRGVTDQLIQCSEMALEGNSDFLLIFSEILNRHKHIWDELYPDNSRDKSVLLDLFSKLGKDLYRAPEYQNNPLAFHDLIVGYGEQFSTYTLATYMTDIIPACYVNGRDLIVTNENFGNAQVDYPLSQKKIMAFFSDEERIKTDCCYIVTGFIGETTYGQPTTLGRDGSNFTAATLGAALRVKEIQIWSDVDGVLSANPKFVPESFVLSQLSYHEALDFSNFGAKVIKSIITQEVIDQGIPILIKNTNKPQEPGTYINAHFATEPKATHAIGTVEDLVLINIRMHQPRLIGDLLNQIMARFDAENIRLVSSSMMVCLGRIYLAVPEPQADRAEAILRTIMDEQLTGQIIQLDIRHNQVMVTFATRSLAEVLHDTNRAYRLLQREGISVNAIVQGGEQCPFIVFVDANQAVSAINVFHRCVFKEQKTMAIALVGVGKIGSMLLEMIHETRESLQDHGIDLRVCAIANRSGIHCEPLGIDLAKELPRIHSMEKTNITGENLVQALTSVACEQVVIVDCTASDDFVSHYRTLLAKGYHIVAANKRANVLPYADYQALHQEFKANRAHFLYSTNVGAGLPILSTLKDLVLSGDTIVLVQALLSGTLGYLFSHFKEGVLFSDIIYEAQRIGLTEPNVAEDLSGMDVARKLLIIARQLGYQYNLEDVAIEHLVPLEKPIDFATLDKVMAERLAQANANGKVLRYMAQLNDGKPTCGLCEVDSDSPLAKCQSTDNVAAFYTKRYSDRPLVIQGAGAGIEVTAMGLLSDIMKLARMTS